MPPQMRGSPMRVAAPAPAPATSPQEQKAAEMRAKIEERNRERSEKERKKAAYQEWLAANDTPVDPNDGKSERLDFIDGIKVTDDGVFREAGWVRDLGDGPDPPLGRDSTVNHWLSDKMQDTFATCAARQSVRVQVDNGVIQRSIGFDKKGNFHPVRHFHQGSAYERYRRGMPPGYMGYIPQDAIPVTGGKIGVIEKKHPVMYSTVRPATGAVVADILDDKVSNDSGVGDFEVVFRTQAANDVDGDGVADGAVFTRSGA